MSESNIAEKKEYILKIKMLKQNYGEESSIPTDWNEDSDLDLMKTSYEQTVEKLQAATDREQMVAGIKLGQQLLKTISTRPGVTREEMDNGIHQAKKLSMPERFKDISAEMLKRMILDEYISDASVQMIECANLRCTNFKIRQSDKDLIGTLQEHWLAKGIACVVAGDKDGSFLYKLSW